MVRIGSAIWHGSIMDGSGTVSTESGTLENVQYSFKARFESGPGTNPEELLAAAHAGCFSMALSGVLGSAGLTAEWLATTAHVSVVKEGEGFVINKVHLVLEAKVPGTTDAHFQELAAAAKVGCPVSKLFNAEITLDAVLIL